MTPMPGRSHPYSSMKLNISSPQPEMKIQMTGEASVMFQPCLVVLLTGRICEDRGVVYFDPEETIDILEVVFDGAKV